MVSKMLLACAVLLLAVGCGDALKKSKKVAYVKAKCKLGFGDAKGTIFFKQDVKGGPTKITSLIFNVSPGLHGWHVHALPIENGDCLSTGGHFNPLNVTHGAPENPKDMRHFGDLGNFEANEKGIAKFIIKDEHVGLVGPEEFSVLGRSIVIHAGEDDLGLGGDDASLANGNAGARVGCCVITKL